MRRFGSTRTRRRRSGPRGSTHPDMPQGRPFFVQSAAVPEEIEGLGPLEQLDRARAQATGRVRSTPGSSTASRCSARGPAAVRRGGVRPSRRARPGEPDAKTAAALVGSPRTIPQLRSRASVRCRRRIPTPPSFGSTSDWRFSGWARSTEAREAARGRSRRRPARSRRRQASELLDRLGRGVRLIATPNKRGVTPSDSDARVARRRADVVTMCALTRRTARATVNKGEC